jgi:hypothetical protein
VAIDETPGSGCSARPAGDTFMLRVIERLGRSVIGGYTVAVVS